MTDVSTTNDDATTAADGTADDAAQPLLIADPPAAAAKPAYQVLARKYRPQTFDELIGQDALVRTLTNAIREDRIAHAFILTGVRGVGKTTTARIIARALNCIGPDGNGGPTTSPCGVCDPCRAIADSRHVDVMEMDAASRTGVDNIRDLTDGVRYHPVSARFKVYIIDEVHMLSIQAFNALLKTLEEPPEHVKFVFATTEVRKVPVTVLSRCQRFDLRRVDSALLVEHFAGIVEQEVAEAEPEALALIANAAEGSVRDGLSLLDQAIAHGGGKVTADQVRDMLGLADRTRVFDLFDAVMRGDAAGALTQLREQYDLGADPLVVLQDMLDLTHWLTRLKVVPQAADRAGVSEAERTRGSTLAEGLGMPALARAWQMLMKGIGEVRGAPSAIAAAEMILVRLAYAASLPGPADLARQLSGQSDGPAAGATAASATGATNRDGPTAAVPTAELPRKAAPTAASPAAPSMPTPSSPTPRVATATEVGEARGVALMAAPVAAREPDYDDEFAGDDEPAQAPSVAAAVTYLASFAALAALAEQRDVRLYHDLMENVRLVRFEPGRLIIRPTEAAPANLAQRLMSRIEEWTGSRWAIVIDNDAQGEPPLAEQQRQAQAALLQAAENHPLVQAIREQFPDATIADVRPLDADGDS